MIEEIREWFNRPGVSFGVGDAATGAISRKAPADQGSMFPGGFA
jgi:hypothetical protein